MTSVRLFQSCVVSASANALFLRDHPLSIHKASAVAKRTTRASSPSPPPTWRRHRRNCASPATPFRRRRTAYYPDFLHKTAFAAAPPKLALKRIEAISRPSQEKLRMEAAVPLQNSIEDAMLDSTEPPASHVGRDAGAGPRCVAEDFVPPSPSPSTRSTRSTSSASRTNRLSLTLPIAPPTAYPSRPTPVSSTAPSFPPTPLDSPALLSPANASEFITAIAAQERRVLELREELSRAENDLSRLKKQWINHEAYKKRAEKQNAEPLRPVSASMSLHEDPATRRSVELDRRKALLNQLNQQNTPEKGRRRVFRGGHTRTLSLLSPTKTTDGFSVLDDASESFRPKFEDRDSPYIDRYAPITPSHIAKRASWAPRSTVQPTGVKQIAQDLRHGLWTFMEDLRQATVGDEPITGQGTYLRGNDGALRSTLGVNASSPLGPAGDQDTIRASGANSRPRAAAAFEETPTTAKASREDGPKNADGEEEPTTQQRTLTRSNTEGAKSMKRFSWTPLTVDSYDDNDWSNWDSPSVNSPTRWSGTTVNGDIIPSIPEKRDENDSPLKSKSSRPRLSGHNSSPSAHKLEELLPPMLNRLAPSNIKKATSELMKEWERSLYPESQFPAAPVAASGDRSV